MKLKELEIVGGSVYLNIVGESETVTMTLKAEKAVEKYGEYEVMEHIPYSPEGENASEESAKKEKKSQKAGTDVVILKG